MCCCPSRICCLCLCLILAVIAIGFVFGFGVFGHGFHKIKDALHECDPAAGSAAYCGRPFLGFGAPPPF